MCTETLFLYRATFSSTDDDDNDVTSTSYLM